MAHKLPTPDEVRRMLADTSYAQSPVLYATAVPVLLIEVADCLRAIKTRLETIEREMAQCKPPAPTKEIVRSPKATRGKRRSG